MLPEGIQKVKVCDEPKVDERWGKVVNVYVLARGYLFAYCHSPALLCIFEAGQREPLRPTLPCARACLRYCTAKAPAARLGHPWQNHFTLLSPPTHQPTSTNRFPPFHPPSGPAWLRPIYEPHLSQGFSLKTPSWRRRRRYITQKMPSANQSRRRWSLEERAHLSLPSKIPLTKQNVSAWGVFTRTGGTIAVFGTTSRSPRLSWVHWDWSWFSCYGRYLWVFKARLGESARERRQLEYSHRRLSGRINPGHQMFADHAVPMVTWADRASSPHFTRRTRLRRRSCRTLGTYDYTGGVLSGYERILTWTNIYGKNNCGRTGDDQSKRPWMSWVKVEVEHSLDAIFCRYVTDWTTGIYGQATRKGGAKG